MMHILAGNQGFIIHAAGVQIGGSGYIFPGKSGAGKSTLTRQFAGRPGTGLLSDDRVAVRRIGGCFHAFGTPWPGEGKVAVNGRVPLAGIFFILKGSRNEIKEITTRTALERLLPVVSVPWYDRDVMAGILSFFEELVSRVPVYEMLFTRGPAAADCFEEFLSKREPRG
jgi:serine kinase of HPr protein (carbohydrate metabolism regulator)